MRVAMFSLEYAPLHSGGLGVHVAGLTDYLRRQGDVVDVFCVGPRATASVIAVPAAILTDIDPDPVDVDRLAGIESIRLRHDRTPYDVAHCHDWHGALPAAYLWQRGVPLITTCHLPAITRFHYTGARQEGWATSLEALALRLSRRVIAVSRFVAAELERGHRAHAQKVGVIHNGTDTSAFHEPVARPGSGRVLAVGRITSQKGFAQLPVIFHAVLTRVPHASLRVIGRGPDEESLRTDLRDQRVAHAAAVHPFTDHRTLAAEYHDAHVLAMPSIYEPFGLVAIEAMACGLPVVAYATGGLQEIVTDGVDGLLVPPEDRRAFADALVRVLTDPTLAARLGRQARTTVLTRFRDELCYARVRAAYGA